MSRERLLEGMVGLFILIAIIAFTILALKVSGLTNLFPHKNYSVVASFDDVGGLKVRAPVKIGGVQIGQVSQIQLDPVTFKANVTLEINSEVNDIPDDSSAGILTAGLLGDNYVEITPMYNNSFLKQGSRIQTARSAMVLEKLIGQLIYKIGNSGSETNSNNNAEENHA